MKLDFNIFKSYPTLKGELDALKAEKQTFTTQNTELQAKVAELTATVSDYEKTIAAFPLAKQDWESQLENLKKEHKTQIDALTSQLEAAKTSTNKEVVATLANVGIQEGAIKEPKTEVLTIEAARIKLASLKGKEAQEFYKQNKTLFEQYIKSPTA